MCRCRGHVYAPLESPSSRYRQEHPPQLGYDEIMAIRNNVKTSAGLEVDNEVIRDTWRLVYRRCFLRRALARAYDCRKAFWLYHQAVSEQECDCNDVVLFWRIQQMMRATANTLRQQIINREARRLEKRVKEVSVNGWWVQDMAYTYSPNTAPIRAYNEYMRSSLEHVDDNFEITQLVC